MAKQPIFGKDPEKIFRLLLIGDDEQDLSEVQGDVVDSPVSSDSITAKDQVIERLHVRIEGYRIIKVLDEGGMGIVYLTEQQYPVQRPVALKIIKPGMDSNRVMARFEAEQQALARLDHPNIAHVYGGGTTELDRPYFVMEYIEGITITDYCDHHKLTIEDRLALSCKSVRPSIMPIRKESFTEISSHRTSWFRDTMNRRFPRSSISAWRRLSACP